MRTTRISSAQSRRATCPPCGCRYDFATPRSRHKHATGCSRQTSLTATVVWLRGVKRDARLERCFPFRYRTILVVRDRLYTAVVATSSSDDIWRISCRPNPSITPQMVSSAGPPVIVEDGPGRRAILSASSSTTGFLRKATSTSPTARNAVRAWGELLSRARRT